MNETFPPLLIRTPIEVRWRDLDAFNHVNNSTYLTYLEQARLVWLKQVPGTWMDDRSVPVLVASHLNYRRPIGWPADVLVELGVERMGNSSLTIAHRIVDAHSADTVYCDGNVVLAWMDPTRGKPVALPQVIRDAGTPRAR